MALISCPDCGGKVSSLAPTCIHCGYPIASTPDTPSLPSAPVASPEPGNAIRRRRRQILSEEAKALVPQQDDQEILKEYAKRAHSGDIEAYIAVAQLHMKRGEYEQALTMLKNGLEADRIGRKGYRNRLYEQLGILYSEDSPLCNATLAVKYLQPIETGAATFALARCYDPSISNKAFSSIKNIDKAYDHYILALQRDPSILQAYTAIAQIDESEEIYAEAAAYLWIAHQMSPQDKTIAQGYERCLSMLIADSGPHWKACIESIHHIEDIDSRIEQGTSMDRKIDRRTASPQSVRCPYCGSTQIEVMKKGFSVGKAAVGGLLLGPVGLLGGALGSNSITRVCVNCGRKL